VTLTPGAEAAWTIAAGEAASAGHSRIEPAHLLSGVLSLGKLGREADASAGVHAGRVRDEHARLLQALSASGVDPLRLRRRARAQLGRGPLAGPPSGPLSRSLTCKAVFAAAEALAGDIGPVGVAHLLAALAEEADVLTARIVRQGGGMPAALENLRHDLKGSYDELILMLRAEQADVQGKLKQVRRGRRAIGAYKTNH